MLDLDNALDKDTVVVWINPSNIDNKYEGKVVKVVKHNNDLICRVEHKYHHFDNKILILRCDMYPDVKIEVDDFKNAVIGDFGRGLIGITQLGISSFANDLLRAYERGDIPKDPKSIESVLPIVDPKYHDYLRKAYQLIDIDSHTRMISASVIERLKASLVDLYDLDAFMKLKVGDLNLMELL